MYSKILLRPDYGSQAPKGMTETVNEFTYGKWMRHVNTEKIYSSKPTINFPFTVLIKRASLVLIYSVYLYTLQPVNMSWSSPNIILTN